ncbi:L-histidine N(alpha)-methyltransferase [Subsaxibacter sp. CAU 1640]|uniref:L-histidine N(alpha)-methyltransferase n=1 Tax=Subsaxibacter sp. CAU 1640 TaxID=2933271 RepID=UPI002003D565|nr:L-histidine N(alpha)-methyltransferase [Subsaxibacter sp. CAU 1640]MCK7589039.1 L-histidine N(alpha)-methyltransferase [Subsaxibacter sp. CAU 1640]
MDQTFANDIIQGLTSKEKHLPSKYFYDDNGSHIFQEIMKMPEYYLTDSEFEILSLQANQIHEALKFSEPFNIIELGAGDGFKTYKLLEYLQKNQINCHYVPIDISQEAMDILTKSLNDRLPNLVVKPEVGDYFEILKQDRFSNVPNLLLFLGSNIGNYLEDDAFELLRLFNQNMKKGDKLLIGIDLKKNPLVVRKAYFDAGGITKRFNLNLLIRINREFDADFKIDDFDFYCQYDAISGEVKSFLVSLKKQEVHLKKLDRVITFDQNELIWTELSKKYSIEEIEELATKTGFYVNKHFLDCKHYFTDSLWEKK